MNLRGAFSKKNTRSGSKIAPTMLLETQENESLMDNVSPRGFPIERIEIPNIEESVESEEFNTKA